MSDSGLIDWEQLEMIFGEDEDDFDEEMGELFLEFVEDGNARIGTIKGFSFDSEKEAIAKESHKLKGSSSNFGFVRVASALGNIENNIDSISVEAYQASLSDAENDFGASIEEVTGKFPSLRN